MMRVMTPNGMLRSVEKAVPMCEVRIDFNGRSRRCVEPVDAFGAEPTAISLELQHSPFEGTNELFIGNLKPERVTEILRKLLADGYFDFSAMEYQKAKGLDKTVLDGGGSLPYTSDFTFGVESVNSSNMFGMPCGLFPGHHGFVNSWEEEEDDQEQPAGGCEQAQEVVG